MFKIAVFIGMLTLGLSHSAKAQTIIQVTEQLALDIQKLSELKGILQDMYDAYKIVDKGLGDIKDIVNGNFDLHKAFLDGLLAVSPTVKNYSRVADIVQAEYTIVSEYTSGYKNFKASGRFSSDEITYIGNIYSNLLSKSSEYVGQLVTVLTANELRMGDGERLGAIDRIYSGIMGNLNFLRHFNGSASIQQVQRAKENADLGVLNSLY